MLSSLLLPLLAATISRAADDYSSSSSSYSAQATPKVHKVDVGPNGKLEYVPSYIDADVGDKIVFTFHPKNHTVTQSSFDYPCSPLNNGINSGFRPVQADTTYGLPEFTVEVKDKNPLWIHCEQPGPPAHCQQGMVFAANAPKTGDKTFDAFKRKAQSSGGSTASTYSSPPQSTSKVHEVEVGPNGQLKYYPEYIKAEIGDKVVFKFNPKNHTATQSSFDEPCTPLYGGFDSNFRPVASASDPNRPEFTVEVKDKNPIWVHCRQKGPPVHCQQGMVFAVNPADYGDKTFDAFKRKAQASGGSSSSTYSAAPPQETSKIHEVEVGPNGQLKYYPEYIKAEIGDKVVFKFNPKNHTATQSSFDEPCTPLYGGFDSNFRPVASASDPNRPEFTVEVKDKNPIWVHCRQKGPPVHCQQGMVFAVNPADHGDKTFDAFKRKAQASGGSSSSTYSAAPPQGTSKVHEVEVGPNGQLKYYPEYIKAEIGDKVVFKFNPKNHTATQSSFDEPCTPLYGGFDSNFRPVANALDPNRPEFTVEVKDKNPIWVHCRQKGPPVHCQQGMVFAVNPADHGDKTFDAFKRKAQASGGSSSSTYSAAPPQGTSKVHEVEVGPNGQLKYYPEYIKADIGDKVVFKFNPKNHTATQSSFDEPCTPLYGGFDSNFRPVASASDPNRPEFTVEVKDKNPIWVHCRQKGPPVHCQQGMVFAVNPADTGDKTFDAFKRKAQASSASSNSASHGSYTSQSYGSNTNTDHSPEPTRAPVTHKIIVGGQNGNVYTPNSVDAWPGDSVVFEFHQKNHTVTQSSFNDPCTKLEISSHGEEKGFDSGFHFVAPDATSFPTYTIKIKDRNPIWGYCRQTGHCQSGMGFGINAPKYGPHTIEAFIQLAKHSNATTLTADYSTTQQWTTSTYYVAKPTSSGY